MTTQKATWKGFELLDRQSVLVAEDGSKDELDPDLAAALQANLGPMSSSGMRSFLTELLASEGISSMDDLGGEQLTTLIAGICA